MINLLPESNTAPPKARRRYNRRSVVFSVCFAVFFIPAFLLQEADRAPVLSASLFLIGIGCLLATIYEFVHLVRALDELQQSIHVTALACAFGGAAVFGTMTSLIIGFFWGGEALPADEFGAAMILPLGVLAYYVSLHLLMRRFR